MACIAASDRPGRLTRTVPASRQQVGKVADLTPQKTSSLASPHRPEASDGAFDAPRRE